MKIFVTGGTGFLGRHLVWRLADHGHEVQFSGRDAVKAREVLLRCPRAVQYLPLSHGKDDSLQRLTRASAGADAVVHCAALSSPWGRRRDFHMANVQSVVEVLAAMEVNGISRLVHISTPSIYFEFRDRIGVHEDDALPLPVNYYAETKLMAEKMVRSAPVSAVILRPRGIFGPWDQTLLPRLMRLMHKPRFPVFNDGDALIDLTYVENVVDAIVLALMAKRPSETTFNISNGQPIRAGELFARLSEAFALPYRPMDVPLSAGLMIARLCELAGRLMPGWEPPLTRYSVGTVAYSQTLNLQRAHDLLGYVPKVDLTEGIRRTSAWMRDQQGPHQC